ncbi:TetR family transcriptional regulator [Acrocarpospora phusangensis]|uniref:TetR family transcriptional regulator n=1 Tax=Acrocarpospora phusangensis TaxID=1070424 RepID=A0A919QDF0_9ACTN|nr:TetR family transcriptional regulator [Acrocarpospora phusangensis]GIH26902.1 TetR family transcriptional regulator [Acrocarpospora phusangensis]
MAQVTFIRARRPEQKRLRREAILVAARELAIQVGVQQVSLGGVAAAVGLAKSNVVRYFGTREEIYLELAADAWQEWGEAVTPLLRAGGDPIAVLTETLEARPLFCDLLSQTVITLERNVSMEAARVFKRLMLRIIAEVGAEVAAARPGLTESEGAELVGTASALAGTLYPIVNPSPVMVELYAQNPDIAAACPRFAPTMLRTLTAIAIGLPAMRERDQGSSAKRSTSSVGPETMMMSP